MKVFKVYSKFLQHSPYQKVEHTSVLWSVGWSHDFRKIMLQKGWYSTSDAVAKQDSFCLAPSLKDHLLGRHHLSHVRTEALCGKSHMLVFLNWNLLQQSDWLSNHSGSHLGSWFSPIKAWDDWSHVVIMTEPHGHPILKFPGWSAPKFLTHSNCAYCHFKLSSFRILPRHSWLIQDDNRCLWTKHQVSLVKCV